MNNQYKSHRIITKISTFISGKTYIQTNMQIGGGCVYGERKKGRDGDRERGGGREGERARVCKWKKDRLRVGY